MAAQVASVYQSVACGPRMSRQSTGIRRGPRMNSSRSVHSRFISWEFPPEGVIKFNTDASVREEDNFVCIGGLLRSCSGSWVFGFSGKIYARMSVLLAEIWAIRVALCLAWERGFRRVIIESDSSGAISKIQEDVSPADPDYWLIMECKSMISRNWFCELRHTLREGNFAADFLAKKGRELDLDLQIWEIPPEGTLKFLWNDVRRVGVPRHGHL